MFKVGDRVRCVNKSDYVGDHELTFGKEYTVKTVHKINHASKEEPTAYIEIENNNGGTAYYKADRFELVEQEVVQHQDKPFLTMSFAGNTIYLDPSIPFSRKFADVMLDVAYNFNKENK